MKLRFLALLAACTVLCFLAACEKEPSVTDDTATPATVTPSASDTPASSTASPVSADDQAFVTTVGQVGMTEVSAGTLAGSKSSNADVKSFGALMVTDHTRLGDELKQLAAREGFTFPTDVGPANQQTLDDLAALSGSAFDNAYITGATGVAGHEQAVQAFENESKNAQNPDLKAWATASLPVIQMHLDMAKEIAAKLK